MNLSKKKSRQNPYKFNELKEADTNELPLYKKMLKL